MSEATKQAMDAAIAAHYADECDGALINGYLLQITGGSIDDYDEDRVQLLREVAHGQTFITTMGLVEYARTTVRDSLYGSEDDD